MVSLNSARTVEAQLSNTSQTAAPVSGSTSPSTGRDDLPTFCYGVHGHVDPGLIPRVLEMVAKRGLVPTAFHAVQSHNAQQVPELTIDMQVDGLSPMTAEVMAEAMRQIPCVSDVYFSARRRSQLPMENA